MLDDPEEDAMLERINAKEKEQLAKQQGEDTSEQAEELPDTEDEAEEETVAPDPEPAPKPVVKKKKVVRKKKKADE